MTPESLYLYTERLGILCGDAEPTEAQKQIAEKQVEEYEKELAGLESGRKREKQENENGPSRPTAVRLHGLNAGVSGQAL